jgi:hypothetical protein
VQAPSAPCRPCRTLRNLHKSVKTSPNRQSCQILPSGYSSTPNGGQNLAGPFVKTVTCTALCTPEKFPCHQTLCRFIIYANYLPRNTKSFADKEHSLHERWGRKTLQYTQAYACLYMCICIYTCTSRTAHANAYADGTPTMEAISDVQRPSQVSQ